MHARHALVVAAAWLVGRAAPAAGESARVRGAVRLGALFAVHGAPMEARAGAACGMVREHYGIQRVEATLMALDAINADRRLLPWLRLGADLRDSCWAAPTALRQTIDLVRDAIAPSEALHRQSLISGKTGLCAAVSYSATARELSDRARFSTFFRVVPSDKHQARLLVALLRAHNWTYVHALHTDESYGQSGMAAFREEAARGGVCVAREVALRAAPSAAAVDAALAQLARGPQVAVCWCEGRTARALLAGLARAPRRRLRLVASDGWADRRDVVEGLEHAALHALTLRIRSPYLDHFDRYYLALTPHNNSRNPWFQV
ncbi:unnamed protein product [Spodoptera littoralis]|uniref:Receptor ligand binding region domain-containing protein n=1 Tax=Spodoptera littoralis TaxID=7109 RepID=A0A9P0HWI5_SPOLI|nr:unnamed protein product [Spodoptera littoralis]CAH1636686.1 unnamed protein product [Spodoptera littoralis]